METVLMYTGEIRTFAVETIDGGPCVWIGGYPVRVIHLGGPNAKWLLV